MEFLLVLLFATAAFAAEGNDWTYKDPTAGVQGITTWNSYFKGEKGYCDGKRNSPIDLTGGVKNDDLGAWTLTNWDKDTSGITMRNTGQTVQFDTNAETVTTNGGGLGADYVLGQAHFHWGSNKAQGSEHTIGGKKYAAEMHFVHWKKSYGTFTDAVAASNGDGAAVLGVMIEEGAENAAFNDIVAALESIPSKENETAPLAAFKLNTLLPSNTKDFYRYLGGLTTPDCREVVVWTVFQNPITLSTAQLDKFRAMKRVDGKAMSDNYRPVVSLNDRKVHTSFEPAGSSATSVTPMFALVSALAVLIAFH